MAEFVVEKNAWIEALPQVANLAGHGRGVPAVLQHALLEQVHALHRPLHALDGGRAAFGMETHGIPQHPPQVAARQGVVAHVGDPRRCQQPFADAQQAGAHGLGHP